METHEGKIAPASILKLLRDEFSVKLLLHEGGPVLFGDFVAHGCVDELFLTVAPQLRRARYKAATSRCDLWRGVPSGDSAVAKNRQREAELPTISTCGMSLRDVQRAPGSVPAETASLDWINRGAASRSSSGRFMVKAAASLPCRNHQTLKLGLERSPRSTTSSAPEGSPQNS